MIDRIYPQVLDIINKQRNINGAPQKSALRYSISESLYTIRKGFSWTTQQTKNKFDNLIHWEATKR